MESNKIIKFLIIFGLAGILGGGIFGVMLALFVLAIIYAPSVIALFAVIVLPFYLWSIFKQFFKKRWFVVIRRFFEVFLVSTFLAGMFSLEEGLIAFNGFDWIIIYICIGFVAVGLTVFLIISEYYPKSWIYIEIEHIITGMQISGLIPEFEDEKEK